MTLIKYSIVVFSLLSTYMSNCVAADPSSNAVNCSADVNRKLWDSCYGTFTDQFQVVYSGNWINGSISGQGVIDFPDGRKYVGSLRGTNIYGKGAVYDPNGNVITSGTYRNGEFMESDGNTKPLPITSTSAWKAEEKRQKEVEEMKRSMGPSEKAKFGDGTPEHQACFKFGFTGGTLPYSDCRLKLEMNKQYAAQRQATFEAEQQRYQEQVAAFEKEKERQKKLAQMRYGLALMGSTSPTFAGGIADANRAMGWAPPEPPKLQPFTIQGPKGTTTCTVMGNIYNCF